MKYEVIKSGQFDPVGDLRVLRGGFGTAEPVFAKRTHFSAQAFPLTPLNSKTNPVKLMLLASLPRKHTQISYYELLTAKT